LLVILITFLYIFACLGAGLSFLSIIRVNNTEWQNSDEWVRTTTEFVLGQGILANIWVVLAIYGWFSPAIIITCVLILAILAVTRKYKSFFTFLDLIKKIIVGASQDTFAWKLIAGLTSFLCIAWISSIGRSPLGDGSGFYLALPKIISSTHFLTPLPGFEELTSIGLQAEMHFAALMSMGSAGAAQLFSWPTILAGSIMLVKLAEGSGIKRRGKWLLLAMLFSSSAVIELSGNGKTDLFAATFGLTAYYWAFEIRNGGESLAFWLTGIFGSLALVAKISYAFTFVPSISLIIAWSYWNAPNSQRERMGHLLGCFLKIGAGALIFILPHLFKNYMLFNNALAPLGFNSIEWRQYQNWNGPETAWRILSSVPFALTFGQYWAQIGNISPLMLMFLPLAIFLRTKKTSIHNLLYISTFSALIGMTAWFLFRPTVFAPRYFFACVFLFFLLAARSAEYASENLKSTLLSSSIPIFTILILTLTILIYSGLIFLPKESLLYLSGNLSECEKEPRHCKKISLINQTAQQGGRLFTTTYLRYWFRTDLIQCGLTTDEINAYINLDTPDQRWNFIYGRGFRYVPLYTTTDPLEILIARDLEKIPSWLSITRYRSDKFVLLELASTDAAHRPQVICEQTSDSRWALKNN
jgi:hypothetical protein